MARQKEQKTTPVFDMTTTIQAEITVRCHTLALPEKFLDSSRSSTSIPHSVGKPRSLVPSLCREQCTHEKTNAPDFARDDVDLS